MPVSLGRVASSRVTAPVGSQARANVLSRAMLAVRQIFFTTADVQKPERLYQILSLMQANLVAAIRPLAENPTLGGVLKAGLVFTGGTALVIDHGLGRAYSGFYCVRAQGAAWSGVEAALPIGVPPSRQIAIATASSGTFDVWIY